MKGGVSSLGELLSRNWRPGVSPFMILSILGGSCVCKMLLGAGKRTKILTYDRSGHLKPASTVGHHGTCGLRHAFPRARSSKRLAQPCIYAVFFPLASDYTIQKTKQHECQISHYCLGYLDNKCK